MKRTITTEVFAIQSPYLTLKPEDLKTGDIGKMLMYSTTDMNGSNGYTVIGKGTVTVELFEIDEISSSQIAVLKSRIQKVQAESNQLVGQLQEQIRNLQALTFEPA